MNDRTKILKSVFKPELAIIVHRSVEDEYYLESHTINAKGNILEGKPLMQETIQAIVDMFYTTQAESANMGGPMPDNVLLFTILPAGNYKLAWYRPAGLKQIHFADQLKIRSGKAHTPAILYVADKKTLHVFALKDSERPKPTTILFRAPFHNVNDHGSVCLGNAQVNKPVSLTFINLMKYWEDLFWLSEFSHLNGASCPTTKPLEEIYRSLIKSNGKQKFPISTLKSSKIDIKAILK